MRTNVPPSGSLSALLWISSFVMYAVCLSVAACPNLLGTFWNNNNDGLLFDLPNLSFLSGKTKSDIRPESVLKRYCGHFVMVLHQFRCYFIFTIYLEKSIAAFDCIITSAKFEPSAINCDTPHCSTYF